MKNELGLWHNVRSKVQKLRTILRSASNCSQINQSKIFVVAMHYYVVRYKSIDRLIVPGN